MSKDPTLRGVVEKAVRTSRRHWRPLLVIAVVVFVPIGLLEVLDHRVGELGPDEVTGPKAFVAVVIGFAHTVTALLGEVFLAGVVAAAVAETYGGTAPTLGHLLRTIPYLTVIAIDILFSIGLALTLILLIVPGVIFFGRYALAAPIAKIEKRGIRDSFRRSRALVRGRFGLVMLALLPIALVGQALSALAVSLADETFLIEWAGATAVELLAAPLWALAAVSLTYELIEHEPV